MRIAQDFRGGKSREVCGLAIWGVWLDCCGNTTAIIEVVAGRHSRRDVASRWEPLPRFFLLLTLTRRASEAPPRRRFGLVFSGREQRSADRDTHGLERLQYQNTSHQPGQDGQRQKSPNVRHLGATELAFVDAVLDKAAEEAVQPAGTEAPRGRRVRRRSQPAPLRE